MQDLYKTIQITATNPEKKADNPRENEQRSWKFTRENIPMFSEHEEPGNAPQHGPLHTGHSEGPHEREVGGWAWSQGTQPLREATTRPRGAPAALSPAGMMTPVRPRTRVRTSRRHSEQSQTGTAPNAHRLSREWMATQSHTPRTTYDYAQQHRAEVGGGAHKHGAKQRRQTQKQSTPGGETTRCRGSRRERKERR